MKITSAMELIAASRIVKAQARVEAAQPYTDKLVEVITNVGAASGGASHPLLDQREHRTAGVLVVTSDRGLAGGYNSNVIRMAQRDIHRSTFFDPLAALEFRAEFDRVRPVKTLRLISDIESEPARRVMALAFLSLFRLLQYVEMIKRDITRRGPLPAPFGLCGLDPTPDDLTCSSFAPCP